MTRVELLELIANSEISGVAFKRDDTQPVQLSKEVVAFANFRGGRILLGVDDDGNIRGIQRRDLKRWVMDKVFGLDDHPVLQRVADRRGMPDCGDFRETGRDQTVRDRGNEDIHIRVGSMSRLATHDNQARLHEFGGMLHAKLLPVSGSGSADLGQERLKDNIPMIPGDYTIPARDSEWHTRLCGLGFMTGSSDGPPVCTIAGLLLFGYSPRRLLPRAGIRWSCKVLNDHRLDGPHFAVHLLEVGASSWKTACLIILSRQCIHSCQRNRMSSIPPCDVNVRGRIQ